MLLSQQGQSKQDFGSNTHKGHQVAYNKKELIVKFENDMQKRTRWIASGVVTFGTEFKFNADYDQKDTPEWLELKAKRQVAREFVRANS